MIVGTYFDGDDNKDIKAQQHDCYGETLRIIQRGCIEEYTKANFALGDDGVFSKEDSKKLDNGCDHRTLQAGHDFLAAYWRWTTMSSKQDRIDWLIWLDKEAKSWQRKAPDISDSIITILLNQNTEAGYKAEDQLLEALKKYYKGMPEKTTQIKESLEVEKIWSEYEDEMREHQRQQEEARRQRYAERGIIGKIGLFISEHWQSEKDAWQSQRQRHKGLEKEDYRQMFLVLGGAALLLFSVVAFTGIIVAFTSIFDFSFYVGHGDEAPTRVALYAVMASGASFCFFVFGVFFYFKNQKKHSDEEIIEIMNGVRSCLLGSLYFLLYTIVSVLIDWITGNYLYRGTEANSFLQIILMGVYTVTAFFVFYLWARSTNFGPFSRR